MNIADHAGLCSRLMRFAMRLTRNREDAQDLVQDTMLRGWAQQDQYRGDAAPFTWLCQIMKYRHWDLCKRRRETETLDGVESSYPDRAESNITLHEVSAAIDLLPPEFCEPFCLQAFGLEYSEIAAQLGIPIGTVKSRISRARERLEAVL